MVMVVPLPVALATLKAPVNPLTDVTPLPEVANPQLTELSRQTVPVASGRVMVLVPPVDVPVMSKLLVPGVDEPPLR